MPSLTKPDLLSAIQAACKFNLAKTSPKLNLEPEIPGSFKYVKLLPPGSFGLVKRHKLHTLARSRYANLRKLRGILGTFPACSQPSFRASEDAKHQRYPVTGGENSGNPGEFCCTHYENPQSCLWHCWWFRNAAFTTSAWQFIPVLTCFYIPGGDRRIFVHQQYWCCCSCLVLRLPNNCKTPEEQFGDSLKSTCQVTFVLVIWATRKTTLLSIILVV